MWESNSLEYSMLAIRPQKVLLEVDTETKTKYGPVSEFSQKSNGAEYTQRVAAFDTPTFAKKKFKSSAGIEPITFCLGSAWLLVALRSCQKVDATHTFC